MKCVVPWLVAFMAIAAPAAAGNSNVPVNNTDVFLNQVHPFDNPAAASEAAAAVPGMPYVDPVAGQVLTRPSVGEEMAAPHPFDSPAARAEAVRAIPGPPLIDPRAAIDPTRPDVAPLLDEPFPYGMWASPVWDMPPLPGERTR